MMTVPHERIAAITLACGCTSMTVEPTTVYTCPTSADCFELSTGWGIAIITPTTCSTTPVPTATPTEDCGGYGH